MTAQRLAAKIAQNLKRDDGFILEVNVKGAPRHLGIFNYISIRIL